MRSCGSICSKPLPLADAFLQHHSAADQTLIVSTVAEVLRRVPDVTTDELEAAIHLKGEETKAGMAVAKFPGKYLRSAVIRYFVGDAFQVRRFRAKAQQKQAKLESAREAALDSIHDEVDSHATTWLKVRELIAAKMDPHSFSTWIQPVRLLRIAGDTMYLVVPAPEFRHAVERYQELITSAANAVRLPAATIRLVTAEEASPPGNR